MTKRKFMLFVFLTILTISPAFVVADGNGPIGGDNTPFNCFSCYDNACLEVGEGAGYANCFMRSVCSLKLRWSDGGYWTFEQVCSDKCTLTESCSFSAVTW